MEELAKENEDYKKKKDEYNNYKEALRRNILDSVKEQE